MKTLYIEKLYENYYYFIVPFRLRRLDRNTVSDLNKRKNPTAVWFKQKHTRNYFSWI